MTKGVIFMYSDLKAYSLHIQILEIINIILYFIIIVTGTIIGYIISKQFIIAFVGFLLGILIGYFIYAIGQLKADQHKLQIDIYRAIIEKKTE